MGTVLGRMPEGKEMKVIIAGSRDIQDYPLVYACIERSVFTITEVVSGKCRGVDALGERWAMERGIPVKESPANWTKHGKSAGPKRNSQMAEYADALIALPGEDSKGTRDMIRKMKALGKPVHVEEA